jgi:organic hydroperoxide reductase OsmC/OhrA
MGSAHTATIEWSRGDHPFKDGRYGRAHRWRFDGGAVVPASSSPHVVRVPLSDPAAVDPEEAYVAAIASCHLLWFLDVARGAGLVVDGYVDEAVGRMEAGEDGRLWIARIDLHPRVSFVGPAPSAEGLRELHERAHAECFLANSVRTSIVVNA